MEEPAELIQAKFPPEVCREKLMEVEDVGVAVYKKQFVVVKRVQKRAVLLTRTIRMELKIARDFRHDNLNSILGAIHEPSLYFIVTEYCQRGALKDILENDEIKLDNVFVASITFDILKGLSFIHQSLLYCHGNLKSSNCFVDSRWSVKVSGFGLDEFKFGSDQDLTLEQQCQSYFWTAPELLRQSWKEKKPKSQKGDIYSFGIIFHEILARRGPFGDDLVDAVEIINRVKFPKTEKDIYRPDTKCISDQPSYIVNTLNQCWDEDPLKRPRLSVIKNQLAPMRKGLKDNVVDNMMSMMQKYSGNLESMVNERTEALQEEQVKSQRLLHQMLPQSVAEKLKTGEVVEAESFDSISLYFSDVFNFADLSLQSNPFQIVVFLNELYNHFDAIVDLFDVYKVETIGDSYMVVSGLPLRNGTNHAGEIGSMALDLMDSILDYQIPHLPDEKLLLRIGIHSGPCVAGVVGLKMPRYCLFGDTVNTTSRLESNGKGLKIHCSSQCKSLLDSLGGYTTVERGLVAMKGKGELLTYWLLSQDKLHRQKRLNAEVGKYPSLYKALR